METLGEKRKWIGQDKTKHKSNRSSDCHHDNRIRDGIRKTLSILYLCLFATETIFLLEPLIVFSSQKPNQNTESNPVNNTYAFIHSQNGFLILNNAR